MSSDRISSSAGLQGIGLPAATPGPADAARPGPLGRHGPAHAPAHGPTNGSLRKRKAAPDGKAVSPAPRVSIDALHHPKRQALSGLAKDAGSADPAAAKPGPPNLESLAFTQHVTEPTSGKERHADTGRTHKSDTAHSHCQAQVGAWARSVENAGAEGLGHHGLGLSRAERRAAPKPARIPSGDRPMYPAAEGLSLSAAGFGEVGVGARGQTQFVKQGHRGEAAVRGSAELSASAQGSGKLSANHHGVNVQAGGQARAGLEAESGVALRTREAGLHLAGVHVDVTPNATAKGRASLGAQGGGSVFAGVSVPTAQERAAGTRFKAGVEASGSAFAGAKAEGDTGLGIGGNKIGLTGGLWAGAGAEAKAKGSVTQVNGHTTARLELHAGAALGVGGSLGITAQVDVQPVVDAAHKVAKLGHAVAHRLT